MNIQILDSWLREHLKTKASTKEIAEKLSLSSVSVEKLEKKGNDYFYDIEVTTNRPDLMSIIGLARETAAVLKHNKIQADYLPINTSKQEKIEKQESIEINDNPKLVNRTCAVIMEVNVKDSPKYIKERLEATGIRSLNNLIDITNYVMRTVGHPTHVFDFDKIPSKKINIRESRPGEKILTLDGKEYDLQGGDIVADDGEDNIIDLLGVMGLKNSVVDNNTKHILFFIDNNDPHRIRKTSMLTGIRTEAAILNEKGIDPELAMEALLYGIKLYEELADGKVISEIIDIYPNKKKITAIDISEEKINSTIGVSIPLKTSAEILESLGFDVKIQNKNLTVKPPTFRAHDVKIEEDIIEEIARIYGYHNIPDRLPPVISTEPLNLEKSSIYFEDRIREALKYWGFTEVYTYPMVSEELYEGDLENSVTIQNPLNEEFVYMRSTLVPSLLNVVRENKSIDKLNVFEIGNIYEKNGESLPKEILKLASIIKSPTLSFYNVKGLVEQLFSDLGIKNAKFVQGAGESEVSIKIDKTLLGTIEILDTDLINFEINLDETLKYATLKKTHKPVSKFPPVIEDISIIASENVSTGDVITTIRAQSPIISDVTLLDKYEDTRTFHIVYQSNDRNLTGKEVGEIREKILKALKSKHGAKLKE